jgi:hypothetical protein
MAHFHNHAGVVHAAAFPKMISRRKASIDGGVEGRNVFRPIFFW